jgi:hypothetical protein
MSDYKKCKEAAAEVYPVGIHQQTLLAILLAASNVNIDPSAALVAILADAKEVLRKEGVLMSSENGKVTINTIKED